MSLDGFLTFLTLIIAAYGVASETSRLRIRLHLIPLLAISSFFLVLIVHLEIYASPGWPCLERFATICRALSFTDKSHPKAEQIAFYAVLAWMFVGWWIATQRPLGSGSLPTLQRLVDELTFQQRFSELVGLIEPHLPLVVRVAKRDFFWARWRDRRRKKGRLFLHDHVGASGAKEEEAALSVLRTLLLTPTLTEYIALFRARFGVELLNIETTAVHDFCDTYLIALISDTKSTLYYEIKENQNLSAGHNYWFPTHNILLHYLFGNAQNAERLEVWKPVGEWLLRYLRAERNPDYVRLLNSSTEGIDHEKWKDPTFIVIRFFDLMVSAAEYQGIRSHMWLFYFPYFVKQLDALYDEPDPEADHYGEWPTRGAFLIYSMFEAMTDWIGALTSLPNGSPHLISRKGPNENENDNIPKSAILAVGTCLHTVMTSPRLRPSFKNDMFEMVAQTLGRLPAEATFAPFRAALVRSIIRGGQRYHLDMEYLAAIWNAFLEIDWLARERMVDLKEAIENARRG